MLSLPIVFINLSKDAERRERMTAQFAQMGLTASRLPAVWWADLSPAEQRHSSVRRKAMVATSSP
jgi:glycosyl transferase family 25